VTFPMSQTLVVSRSMGWSGVLPLTCGELQSNPKRRRNTKFRFFNIFSDLICVSLSPMTITLFDAGVSCCNHIEHSFRFVEKNFFFFFFFSSSQNPGKGLLAFYPEFPTLRPLGRLTEIVWNKSWVFLRPNVSTFYVTGLPARSKRLIPYTHRFISNSDYVNGLNMEDWSKSIKANCG
jgi:hypothetical protein